jgi:hypothetical protein
MMARDEARKKRPRLSEADIMSVTIPTMASVKRQLRSRWYFIKHDVATTKEKSKKSKDHETPKKPPAEADKKDKRDKKHNKPHADKDDKKKVDKADKATDKLTWTCFCCGESGHRMFECHLVIANKAKKAESPGDSTAKKPDVPTDTSKKPTPATKARCTLTV